MSSVSCFISPFFDSKSLYIIYVVKIDTTGDPDLHQWSAALCLCQADSAYIDPFEHGKHLDLTNPKAKQQGVDFHWRREKKRIQSWDMLRQTHQKPDISSFILVFKPQKSPHFSPAVEAETGPLLPCGMNICQVQTTTSSLRHVFKAVFFVGVFLPAACRTWEKIPGV